MLTVSELQPYAQNLLTNRTRFEADWYKNYWAYENNTFVTFNRQANTLVKMPYRKRFFVNLPEVKKQSDSFENLLLVNNPLFVNYPDDISDPKQISSSQNLSRLLKRHYNEWHAQNIFHDYVHLATKYPISFLDIATENRKNPYTKKMQKTIVPRAMDAFDFLFDTTKKFEDNPVVFKIVRKTLKEIKEYNLFKTPTFSGGKINLDMKEMINNEKYGQLPGIGELQTVACFESMEKTPDGINKITFDAGGHKLNEKFYEGIDFYPTVPLQLYSGDPYQPSFVQNLIPITRSLCLIANRIEDFILKFVKGGYLVRDGSDVFFSDENGIIVKYTGDKPETMNMPQFNMAIITWFNKLFELAERYGVNQYAMGLSARGSQNRTAKQGDQAIKAAQMQQKTPMDSFMQSIKTTAQISIYYLSEFTDEPTSFTFKNESDSQKQFDSVKFIGEKWKDKDKNAVIIPHNIQYMEIEIEDVSHASIQAKKEAIFELAQQWATIPPQFQKVLLDLYKVGNTGDIMRDLERGQTLLDNPEFKNLIDQARKKQLPKEVQQGLAIVLKFLGEQSPVPGSDKMGVTSQGGN